MDSQPQSPLANTFRPLGFRPDIQGLRALAILLVVFCHAGLPGFAGGFIGVDIFFVLSGYLISGLLITEVQETNRIRFLHFYARRFKRLLPALLFVLLCTAGLAYIVLAPFEQISQAQAATSVPLWLSNLYFSFADLDYFAAETSSNLFLHTWSLAVEEQFYLVWPLLLFLLLLKLEPLPGREHDKTLNLRYGLLGLMLLSLGLCIYASWKAPLLSFYLMPTRGWQFALGGLAFLATHTQESKLTPFITPRNTLLAGITGGGLILLSLILLDSSSVYPGINAILPTVGTALLLSSTGTSQSQHPVTRILSPGWLQKIGDLSYSWYLWHWPILLLGHTLFPNDSIKLTVALILLSLFLAQITYSLVENPIRKMPLLRLKPAQTVCLALAFMSAGLTGIRVWESRAETNATSSDQLAYQQIKGSVPIIYQHGCDDWYHSARVLACSYGAENAEKTLVLIGDSIGAQWFSALANTFVSQGWRMVVFTKSACPIVDEPIFYERIGMRYTVCERWREQVIANIQQFKPDLVFIGNARNDKFSQVQWHEGTARILSKLSPISQHLFIIKPTPKLPFDGPFCLARQRWQPHFLAQFNPCRSKMDRDISEEMLEGLSAALTQYPNASLLNLNTFVCPDNECNVLMNNQIVYRDNQHLSDAFVNSLGNKVLEEIQTNFD